MKIEVEILKSEFASKISHHHNKLDSIEFKNANLLQKNACLHIEMRKMRTEIDESNKKATGSVPLENLMLKLVTIDITKLNQILLI